MGKPSKDWQMASSSYLPNAVTFGDWTLAGKVEDINAISWGDELVPKLIARKSMPPYSQHIVYDKNLIQTLKS